jgi:hypothetical protein
MSDSARKRKLADFVVAWKKQVVKLYAVTKWSRDSDIVQKCMVCGHRPVLRTASNLTLLKNITAFLMDQNRQFEDVIRELTYARDSLDSARYKLDPVQLYNLYGHAHKPDYEIMTSSRRWTFSLPVLIGVSLP